VSLQPGEGQNVALADLLDRLIDGGVVLTGDVVLSVADVDLVYVGLRLILAPARVVNESILRPRSAGRGEQRG
jgi:Gas vesicle protein